MFVNAMERTMKLQELDTWIEMKEYEYNEGVKEELNCLYLDYVMAEIVELRLEKAEIKKSAF